VLDRIALKGLGQEALRVLVVEDLDSPRDIISAYIESIGAHHVEQASSAKAAFERLQDESKPMISCVVTDMKMPIHDGIALIEWIRADARLADTPIIMLTAYGTLECLVEALEAGATGFLVKPPKRTDIQRELSRAARLWRRKSDPRLIQPEEVPLFKKALEERGL
jgi:CheY-like chemotaxis protein